VETTEAMRSALREKQWDVILCDYILPNFNGLDVIELLKDTELDIPLLIVSGAIGEETAVEAMKAGANDYIMKDNLYRLIPAIDRELEEAGGRRERRLAEKQLKESNERFIALFDRSNDAVYIVDFEGVFVDANQVALNMLGYDRADIHCLNIASLLSGDDLSKGLKDFNEIVQTGFQKELFEYKLKRKDGTYVTVETKGSIIFREGKPHSVLGIAREITERKQAEEALKTLSLKDDLTGLYNRRGFFALAEQGLKTAQRMGTEMLLIFGDLDNLKGINDTFGHNEGDQALVDTSQILKETFRESDIIARIGGDEFVIMAMNSFETSAEKLINRFKKALNYYHLQTKRSYTLSLSLGIAYFDPQNPCSIDVLLSQADKLMYENKQKKG
jgi:diguanylate cyclase (GGDEF)-like protein/PAS domain S-box-containing protein